MKRLWPLFFLFLASCQVDVPGISSVNTDSVFVIQAEQDNGLPANISGELSYGTGFFVEPSGKAYTAAHVVENDDYNYYALLKSGERLPIRVMNMGEDRELAFLQVDPKNLGVFPYLDLSTSNSFDADQYYAFGAAQKDYELLRLQGELLDSGDFLIFDFHTPRGTSGGPILNEEGEVVGVIHGYSKETLHGYGLSL